jgi:hypothetical protein
LQRFKSNIITRLGLFVIYLEERSLLLLRFAFDFSRRLSLPWLGQSFMATLSRTLATSIYLGVSILLLFVTPSIICPTIGQKIKLHQKIALWRLGLRLIVAVLPDDAEEISSVTAFLYGMLTAEV